MTDPGVKLADIGTDHAFLPVSLCLTGKIPGAIAADVRPGPLSRAEEHIREAGLTDVIETRLSDGLMAFKPGEVREIVIAGMGGRLMIRILTDAADVTRELNTLILEPQSETGALRKKIAELGFCIERENMILEDGKYYPVIRAVRGETGPVSDCEAEYGPLLLKEQNPVLHKFLLFRRRILLDIDRKLKEAGTEAASSRRKETEVELRLISEALQYYEM